MSDIVYSTTDVHHRSPPPKRDDNDAESDSGDTSIVLGFVAIALLIVFGIGFYIYRRNKRLRAQKALVDYTESLLAEKEEKKAPMDGKPNRQAKMNEKPRMVYLDAKAPNLPSKKGEAASVYQGAMVKDESAQPSVSNEPYQAPSVQDVGTEKVEGNYTNQ